MYLMEEEKKFDVLKRFQDPIYPPTIKIKSHLQQIYSYGNAGL